MPAYKEVMPPGGIFFMTAYMLWQVKASKAVCSLSLLV